MSDITTLRDALQELVDRDCTVVDRTIEIRFASHAQAMRVLREAREAYRAVDVAGAASAPLYARAPIPAGYVLVPAEPTEAMVQAAGHIDLSYMPGQEGADRAAIYRAMIAAAQEPKP